MSDEDAPSMGRGILHPEGIKFTCNLAHYEERTVIDYLVQLAEKEPGGRVMGCTDERNDRVPVPASWADKGVPCDEIVFRCMYETSCPNGSWRGLMAERYCVGSFA